MQNERIIAIGIDCSSAIRWNQCYMVNLFKVSIRRTKYPTLYSINGTRIYSIRLYQYR